MRVRSKETGRFLLQYDKATRPTYCSWHRMVKRCRDHNNKDYLHYGGRGITVCSRWLHFPFFLDDMGLRPSGTSLDRINNDGNYEPGNCRWATQKQQVRNRRITRTAQKDGVTLPIAEWAERLGIDKRTLLARRRLGWSDAKVLADTKVWPAKLAFNGRSLTFKEWERETGVPAMRIYNRVRDGWSIDAALTTPYPARTGAKAVCTRQEG